MTTLVDEELLEQLDGFYHLRLVTLAFTVVVVYDQIICFEEECTHFWSHGKASRWNETKILYIINRYLTILPLFIMLAMNWVFAPTQKQCGDLAIAYATWSAITFYLQSAVMTARVYHLFARYRGVKFFTIVAFMTCVAVSSVYQGFGINELQNYNKDHPVDPEFYAQLGTFSCFAEMRLPPTWGFWKTYMPLVGLHSLLFVGSVIRLASGKHQRTALMNKLLRDSAISYFVVVFMVVYTVVGGRATSNPALATPANTGIPYIAIMSVCTSRLLLSLKTLAMTVAEEPTFLLHNVELERLSKALSVRRGRNEFEVYVTRRFSFSPEDENTFR